jgi:hypothetical protein
MKATLKFSIECGETTCAVKRGKFCEYMLGSMNGQTGCYFFGATYDVDGWTQRHPKCLEMAEVQHD